MERSEHINEIAGAMAKAQAKMSGAKKESKNPHFQSKYADLDSAWEACREALTANGVAVIQSPEAANDNGSIAVVTLLAHSSGQWISGELSCRPVKFDAQGVGSVVTYLRRYALMAMVGIAPADDDGEAAAGRMEPSTGRAANVSRGKARAPEPPPAPEQPSAASNDNDDWQVWIDGFKEEFSQQATYTTARELWNYYQTVLQNMKEKAPVLYSGLLDWVKTEGDKLPKVGG